jgi:adenylate cyclase
VSIYEALEHHTPDTFPNLEKSLASFVNGLEAYRQRNWHEAIGQFDSALAANPSDRPSQIYRDRCVHFLSQPPEDAWDGVWVLKEK